MLLRIDFRAQKVADKQAPLTTFRQFDNFQLVIRKFVFNEIESRILKINLVGCTDFNHRENWLGYDF